MPERQNLPQNGAFLDLKTLFSQRENKVGFDRTFPLTDSVDSVELCGEARVFGTISDYSGVLQFQAELSLDYQTQCDRCLKPITRTLKVNLDRPITKTVDEDSEEETVLAENDVIDLALLCYEGLYEHLPLKHLCSEDCRGLCPYCGTDLNEAPCSCKAPPDPRLAGLVEFFHE